MSLINGWRSMQTSYYKDIFEKISISFLFNHPFLSVLALSIDSEFKEANIACM